MPIGLVAKFIDGYLSIAFGGRLFSAQYFPGNSPFQANLFIASRLFIPSGPLYIIMEHHQHLPLFLSGTHFKNSVNAFFKCLRKMYPAQ